MTRMCLLNAAAVLAASVACGAHTATQELREPSSTRVDAVYHVQPPRTDPIAVVPQNPVDRSIRRDLTLAIDRDPALKDRGISFIVSNGDVSVTGIVRTEDERERINGLALGIPGVRSVANALRVSP